MNEPPGPKRKIPGSLILSLRRSPIKFLKETSQKYGELSHFRVGNRDVYLVISPDLVQEVLVTQSRVFVKREGKGRSNRGEGILTTASDFSLRRRPAVSPSFHREKLDEYVKIIQSCYGAESSSWREGEILDVHATMHRLTLLIIGKTLFGTDLTEDADKITGSMKEFLEFFSRSTMPLAGLVERLPFGSNRSEFREARKQLDSVIYRMIDEAKRRPAEDSLLSRLANDESGGRPMTDSQIRDEALTILLAGH